MTSETRCVFLRLSSEADQECGTKANRSSVERQKMEVTLTDVRYYFSLEKRTQSVGDCAFKNFRNNIREGNWTIVVRIAGSSRVQIGKIRAFPRGSEGRKFEGKTESVM